MPEGPVHLADVSTWATEWASSLLALTELRVRQANPLDVPNTVGEPVSLLGVAAATAAASSALRVQTIMHYPRRPLPPRRGAEDSKMEPPSPLAALAPKNNTQTVNGAGTAALQRPASRVVG